MQRASRADDPAPPAEIRHPWFGCRPVWLMPSNKRCHASPRDGAPVNSGWGRGGGTGAGAPSCAPDVRREYAGQRPRGAGAGGGNEWPGSAAVTPVTGGVVAQGTQEVHLAEGRPEDLAEVVLRMGGLPEHESGQPLLAAGADDQVRVGLLAGVEVTSDHVD